MGHSPEHKKAISEGLKKHYAKKSGSSNWISKAIKRPGALHRALHVPQGQKIPASKLAKAEHSSNSRIAKEANLAKTLKKLHK